MLCSPLNIVALKIVFLKESHTYSITILLRLVQGKAICIAVMTSYTTGKLLCQMCCCSAKQSLQAERLVQSVAIFYVLSGLKDKHKLYSLEKAFLKLNKFAEQNPHLRNLNMQAAYKIHAGFLQHIQEIFKNQANLSPGILEFLEIGTACYSLCCSTPHPWQQIQ